jgi:hypothetical protein
MFMMLMLISTLFTRFMAAASLILLEHGLGTIGYGTLHMTGWETFRSLILRKVICKTVATRKSLGSDLLLAILLRSLIHAPNPSALALHGASRTLSTHILPMREVALGRQENANDRNRYNNRRPSTTIIKECSDPH